MEFFRFVKDQLVNLTPMGLEGGGAWLAPRLEAWESATRLLKIPREKRVWIIRQARYLHAAVEKRVHVHGLFRMDPEELVED